MGDADAGARDGCVAPRAKERIRPWCWAAFPYSKKSVAANYLTPRRLLAITRVRNGNSAKAGRNSLAWIPAKAGDGPAAFSVEGCRYGRWLEGRDDDHVYQQPDAETMRAVVDLAKPPDPRGRLLGPRSVTDTVTDTALDKNRNAMRA